MSNSLTSELEKRHNTDCLVLTGLTTSGGLMPVGRVCALKTVHVNTLYLNSQPQGRRRPYKAPRETQLLTTLDDLTTTYPVSPKASVSLHPKAAMLQSHSVSSEIRRRHRLRMARRSNSRKALLLGWLRTRPSDRPKSDGVHTQPDSRTKCSLLRSSRRRLG